MSSSLTRMWCRFCCALFVCVIPACSTDEDVVAIDLALVSDLRINTAERVLRDVRSLLVIVDSPSGLYPPGSERMEGNVAIEDTDGDPSDLELVATVPISEGRLPNIRLERGSLPDVPLDIQVRGLSDEGAMSSPVAVGGARGLVFEPVPSEPIVVPFNLVPGELAPRVLEIYPLDEQPTPGCYELRIMVAFSKPMDEATFDGHVWADEDGWGRRSPDVSVEAHLAQISFTPDLGPGGTLYVSSDVADSNGAHLDQVVALEGDQPFQRLLRPQCDEKPREALCNIAAGRWCPGPEGRFRCVDGRCVLESCRSVACPDGYACDPATALCDVDCRIYGDSGSCPEERPVCDSTSGACVAVLP